MVGQALGGAPVDRVELLGTAASHRVLRVTLAGGDRLVLKVGAAGAPLPARRTATVHRLARAEGVPVAAVIASGSTTHGLPYLLLEHLDGVPWRDAALGDRGRAALQRDLAGVVLALRRIRFPSFGGLDDDGRPVGADLLAALSVRAERIEDPAARTELRALLREEAARFADPAPSVLVHDDLHPGNLLVGGDPARPRLVGVLDWDKAWAGPADADVARLAFWDGMAGPAFWAALGEQAPDAAADRRRMILQLLWALEFAEATPRHRADTARLRRRLGLR